MKAIALTLCLFGAVSAIGQTEHFAAGYYKRIVTNSQCNFVLQPGARVDFAFLNSTSRISGFGEVGITNLPSGVSIQDSCIEIVSRSFSNKVWILKMAGYCNISIDATHVRFNCDALDVEDGNPSSTIVSITARNLEFGNFYQDGADPMKMDAVTHNLVMNSPDAESVMYAGSTITADFVWCPVRTVFDGSPVLKFGRVVSWTNDFELHVGEGQTPPMLLVGNPIFDKKPSIMPVGDDAFLAGAFQVVTTNTSTNYVFGPVVSP